MAIKAPYLPYPKLRSIADEFLSKYHMAGEMPVPIEHIVEFDFGLDIVPMPGLKTEFDIDAYITSDLTEIRVDQYIQRKRLNRYHFSLAHELAHLLIHREIFEQLEFSTIEEWKIVIAAIPENQYGYMESQAYCLGGLILVPPTPLRDLFGTKVEEAGQAGIDLYDATDHGRRFVERSMAPFFAVSAEVIEKRMHYDKLWQRQS